MAGLGSGLVATSPGSQRATSYTRWTTSIVNRRWISLQVSGMSPSSEGGRVCSSAQITARKAWASMARVTQPEHEVKRRSWCSSSPARPFRPGRSLPPAISTRRRGPVWPGAPGRRPAAVVGEFTGAAIAADQQPVAAGPGLGQVNDGPVVEACPLAPAPADSFCPARGHLRGSSGLVAKRCPRPGPPPGSGPGRTSTSAARTVPGPPPRARALPAGRVSLRPAATTRSSVFTHR